MSWFVDYPIAEHPIPYSILFLILLGTFVFLFFPARPLVGFLLGIIIGLLLLCWGYGIWHWLSILLDLFLGLVIWLINFLFHLIGNLKSTEGMLALLLVVILAWIYHKLT
jgi:hypothetical protein